MVKEIATKDDTSSSSMPTFVLTPPPSIVPRLTFEVIDTAHSNCPPILMSLSIDIFASSKYIAKLAVQPNRHGIEP